MTEKIHATNDELMKLRERGMSYRAIGALFGASRQAVHQRLAKHKETLEKLKKLRNKQ